MPSIDTEVMKGGAIMALYIGGFAGWVMNVMTVVHVGSSADMFTARVVGIIFAPLGAVLGWF